MYRVAFKLFNFEGVLELERIYEYDNIKDAFVAEDELSNDPYIW